MGICGNCGEDHEAGWPSDNDVTTMINRVFGMVDEDEDVKAARQQAEVMDLIVRVIEQAMEEASPIGGDGAAGTYKRATWASGYLAITLQPSSINLGTVALGLEVINLRADRAERDAAQLTEVTALHHRITQLENLRDRMSARHQDLEIRLRQAQDHSIDLSNELSKTLNQ
jgi:hypothetical protein